MRHPLHSFRPVWGRAVGLLAGWLLLNPPGQAQNLTITDRTPARNARLAPVGADVALTFNQPISTSPASLSGLRVFSAQRGGLLRNGSGGSASVSGNTLLLNPTTDFKPGERVYVTSTTAIQATGGARLNRGQVYGFTTRVDGSGRGNFTAPATSSSLAVGREPRSVALGDVDGDGDLDMLVANSRIEGIVSMRLNDGSGNFTAPAVDLILGDTPFSVVLGDVDGDGDLDLLCANYFDNNVSVRLNDGRGKFTAPATNPNPGVGGYYPACVVVGDLDGDGDLDFVTANQSGATVGVRLNDGSGNFTAPAVNPNPAVDDGPERVVLGDIDGDGDLDIVNSNNDSNTISILANDGSGSFTTPAVNLVVGERPYSVALGDVDGDGDLDLVHTNDDSVIVSVRLNDGSGNFIAQAVNPEADSPRSVALGDVDGDGDLDLLCASSNTVSVRLNDGSGKFTAPAVNPNPRVGDRPYYVALGDLDGDGDLDFVTADRYDNSVSVRLNRPLPPTLTSLSATPNPVCEGQPLSMTASVGNVSGSYSYTLASASNVISGTANTAAFSQRLTATGLGVQSFTLTVNSEGQIATATTSLTVNPLPTPAIINLYAAYCQDAPAVTLTGNPTGGVFTVDGAVADQFRPTSLSVGQHTVVYSYTNASGCSATTRQLVTIRLVPGPPRIATQSGQSAVSVDLNSGPVTLLVSGCAGVVSWTGPNNTMGTGSSISAPTTQVGRFVYTATCTVSGCTSPAASATVTVQSPLTVLHRDVDNYADNNAIQPLLMLQNQGISALSLSRLTLRYYLTVEGNSALSNLNVNYAQLGNQNVRLRYVPLIPPQTGASGYVEYSFTAGAGSLAAGTSSGPIQAYFTKGDYSGLNELDDYSYARVRNQLVGNLRITAYYDGVLIAGIEPGSSAQVRAVRALTESKNGPSATQINTYLEVRNEGNVAINYSDLKARYYFTADGNERLQVEVDEGNVGTQLVKMATPVNGADTYLELTFNQGGQLAPGASAGRVRYRISKPDGGRFNQANDYSYQEQPQELAQNSRVVVYAGSERIWGQEPAGSARIAFAEAGCELTVNVLGNPIQHDEVIFEVRGAEGQSLRLRLLTPQGRVVSQQQVAVGEATQRYQLSVAGQAGGVLLLQVSTPTQSQTVKVIKSQ